MLFGKTTSKSCQFERGFMNINLIIVVWGVATARFVFAFLFGPSMVSEAECRSIRGGVCYTLGALSNCDAAPSDGGCNGVACSPFDVCLKDKATKVTEDTNYRPECGNASYGSSECYVNQITCGVKETCNNANGTCIDGQGNRTSELCLAQSLQCKSLRQ